MYDSALGTPFLRSAQQVSLQIQPEILQYKSYIDSEKLEAQQRQLESELAQVAYPVLTLPNEIS
jgi:hypothetical protein